MLRAMGVLPCMIEMLYVLLGWGSALGLWHRESEWYSRPAADVVSSAGMRRLVGHVGSNVC